MRTILVTGSDTGVGKTRVVAALTRVLSAGSARVQIVKVVETGRRISQADEGDAACAQHQAGSSVEAITLASFDEPITPASAASAVGREIVFTELVNRVRWLPDCDWLILEGAGGIATPIDNEGRDWVDFAVSAKVDAMILVVPDRLGAINQGRLAFARAVQSGLESGVWLNATQSVTKAVAASSRAGLAVAKVPVWAEQAYGAILPEKPESLRARLLGLQTVNSPRNQEVAAGEYPQRFLTALVERERQGLCRALRVTELIDGGLNLADNDYLGLARDPVVVTSAMRAAEEYGTSASASPLITGWKTPHAKLVGELCAWHGVPYGLLWSSGYAANAAVLSLLPQRGDLVLADRLIHHSMIAGLLRSGARLRRYEHLQLDQLEKMLAQETAPGRTVFVVTESVFSMDGGFPDFKQLSLLKNRYGFRLVVDEAHALGWYGHAGAGLIRGAGVEASVDVLIGTLGKTLASGGAYALFREESVRDYLVNMAGEFIYSTALSPINVATASAALGRVKELSVQQEQWQDCSRRFRARLRAADWQTPEGNSPIVPVVMHSAEAAIHAAAALREKGIYVAAVRPPTVPAGTSRLRFSLKRTVDDAAIERVLAALARWRASQ